MRIKHLFSMSVAVVLTLLVVSCGNSISSFSEKGSDSFKPLPASRLTANYLGKSGFMGGSLLYNTSAPEEGHLVKGAVIAVRLGKVSEIVDEDGNRIFSDIDEAEKLGYIKIYDVDAEKITFAYASFGKEGENFSKNFTLLRGDKADIDEDGVLDVLYEKPAVSKAAFPDAVYLTFLSSQDEHSTAMFAVLTEQYADNAYPSGIIGINNNGAYLYSKYKDKALTVRAAMVGVSTDDFVLDAKNACYVQLDNAPSARVITDEDLEKSHQEAMEAAVQLAEYKARNAHKIPKQVLNVAKTNAEYETERQRILGEFKEYSEILYVPYVNDYVQKLNEYSAVNLTANMGIYGKFSLTWNHVQCDLMSGAYIDARIDLALKKDLAIPLEKLEWKDEYKSEFSIGPIPMSVQCPIEVKMPVEAKIAVDSANMVVKFSGLYGAGVDIGADIRWKKVFTKEFLSASAEPYALSDGIFFFGLEDDELLESARKHEVVTTTITASPQVSLVPGITIGKVISAGVGGNYGLTFGIGASAYPDMDLECSFFVGHKGEIDIVGGVNFGLLRKDFKKEAYKFDNPKLTEKKYRVPMKQIFVK